MSKIINDSSAKKISEADKKSFVIIPTPVKVTENSGTFLISTQTELVIDNRCDERALDYTYLLKSTIEENTGLRLRLRKAESATGRTIFLSTDGCENEAGEKEDSPEAYTVKICEDGVKLCGRGYRGLLYAVQTLRQIIAQKGALLPCVEIEDYPRFNVRGFFHDATRGRIGLLSYYKKLADRAAYYKLNMLSLYVEHTYMFRELTEVWRDDTPLTADDILELDRYCRKLGVELVPALATFGHLDKLLTTKSYAHLCELEGTENEEFSFISRMQHHTINISDERSWELIKSMLLEFIPLFSSKYFNLCGDETFDLGKGRSKALADKIGTDRMYVNFVNRICGLLIEQGKRPMMWGDIIVGSPELIKELPGEVTLLTWGYCENEHYHNAEVVHNAGAKQILCPGVHGWLRLMNRLRPAYENISRMVEYAGTYGGLGVLNTDWGDYGHVSDPDFSTVGMIYGAQGSWHGSLDTFEKENEKISVVEFGDTSGEIVDIIGRLSDCEAFMWAHLVQLEEYLRTEHSLRDKQDFIGRCEIQKPLEKTFKSEELMRELAGKTVSLNATGKERIHSYMLHARGQQLLNMTGYDIGVRLFGMEPERFGEKPAACESSTSEENGVKILCKAELAGELERWFADYRENWSKKSRGSELFRVSDALFKIADLVRTEE